MSETAPKTLHVTVRMGRTSSQVHTFKVNVTLHRSNELVTTLSQIGSDGQGICTVTNHGGTCTIRLTIVASSRQNSYAHRLFKIVSAISRAAGVRAQFTTLDLDKLMDSMTLDELGARLYKSDQERARQASIRRTRRQPVTTAS